MKQIFKIFSYPSKPVQTYLILGAALLVTAVLASLSFLISWLMFPKIDQLTSIVLLLVNGSILLLSHYLLIRRCIAKKKYAYAQSFIQSAMLIIVIFLVLLFEFSVNFQ